MRDSQIPKHNPILVNDPLGTDTFDLVSSNCAPPRESSAPKGSVIPDHGGQDAQEPPGNRDDGDLKGFAPSLAMTIVAG